MENEVPIEQVKEKLLKLSAKGLIKKTSFQIKKMNEQNCRIELEKYEQKMINETADKIKGVIFDGVSNGLSYLEVIDEEDRKRLEEELKTNCYLEEEVINISIGIAPWIPYIGLTLAGLSIVKYAYTRYLRNKQSADCTQKETKGQRPAGDREQSSRRYAVPNKNDGTDKKRQHGPEGLERGVDEAEPQRGD